MTAEERIVNILLVDDQPAKLLSYETILGSLGVNLIKSASGREALEQLLKNDIALVLVDVCMPELDGFQLAEMIRSHPRFQSTAIIFISAVQVADVDYLRGYEMGAVDYVSVPVVPEVLRAKVNVFVELYRKTRQLEDLNRELEDRVVERTAQLESYATRLLQSEQRRTLALAAGQMGSWDWDVANGDCVWDEGQCRIFGVDPARFTIDEKNIRSSINPADWVVMRQAYERIAENPQGYQLEFRVQRPNGETRWCIGSAAATQDSKGRIVRISGVTIDITERKEAEERQALLALEVDHRAKNTLAVIQSIVRLTRADDAAGYIAALNGRIASLSRVHTLLSESRWHGADLRELVDEELAPYRSEESERITAVGPQISLKPQFAQGIALALHELTTNSAKYGALSVVTGRLDVVWELNNSQLVLRWTERAGPTVKAPASAGFGTKIVNATMGNQLGGAAVFDWRPEGLQCLLSLPMTLEHGEALAKPLPAPERSNAAVSSTPAGRKRILVVEDEALVAMMLEDTLVELGFSVVGPCNTVSQALDAARNGGFDAALLDVNLGGQPVYPAADVLVARGVPFCFVTGYGQESVDSRFAAVSVLHKPVSRDVLRDVLGGSEAAEMPLMRRAL